MGKKSDPDLVMWDDDDTSEHTSDHPYCGNVNCPFCHTDVQYHGQVTRFDRDRTPTEDDKERVRSIFGIRW